MQTEKLFACLMFIIGRNQRLYLISSVNIQDLIFSGNIKGLEDALNVDPALASKEIALPDNSATAHPLHRICDAILSGYYSEEIGIALAKVLLHHGADLNVKRLPGEDSPLTAACSLRCDQLALLYLEHGANIDHQGCHGGTALHWAAWCGRDLIVKKLVELTSDINQKCIDFKSTPLFWAIHGYRFGGRDNLHNQVACARILLEHGADPSIPNFEGYLPVQVVEEKDVELLRLFHT
jgi:uncharacterized protein